MSNIRNGRLDQYGAEPFEQQQFGTDGTEGVNCAISRFPVCAGLQTDFDCYPSSSVEFSVPSLNMHPLTTFLSHFPHFSRMTDRH